MISNLFPQLTAGEALSYHQMQEVMSSCMDGLLADETIASFLKQMHHKGETIEELTAAAMILQERAHHIELGDDLIDIVGTGGDGKNLFNVSTVTSFVAAAAGLRVAKHGSHASSGRSGSADLLLAAGFKLDLSDDDLRHCMQECGIVFLFGPHFHPAMQRVKIARKQLGIRTLFNLIGPLINPARVKKQVVGVYPKQFQKPLAQVLVNLGSEHAMVVHSHDGLDEISIASPTDVIMCRQGEYKEWQIDPRDFGCSHPNLHAIQVETPAQSLAIAQDIFAGGRGPARDIVLLNCAAALCCADHELRFSDALEKAAHAIDSGLAGSRFIQLRDLTQRISS